MKRLLFALRAARCQFIYFSLFFTPAHVVARCPIIPLPRGKCVLLFVVVKYGCVIISFVCFSSQDEEAALAEVTGRILIISL